MSSAFGFFLPVFQILLRKNKKKIWKKIVLELSLYYHININIYLAYKHDFW